jgi:hypothetical protein
MTEDIAPAEETTTALAVRGQLAEAQERLAKAEKKKNATDWLVLPGAVGMVGTAVGVVALIASIVSPIAPITIAGAAAVLLGSGTTFGIAGHILGKADENLIAAKSAVTTLQEKKRAAKQARCEALRLAAESVLTRDVGAYAVGQELRVEVADETPKILRIEAVGTELDNEDRQAQKISAQLYETVAQADGGLKRGKRIAKIPTITCSMPLKSPLPGLSVEVAGLAPSPPTRGATEKKLPPCTPI